MSVTESIDHDAQQVLAKARDALHGGEDAWHVQSTGEKLSTALALNRFDWLMQMDYTIAEALERIGPLWAKHIPSVAKRLEHEQYEG